MWRRGSVIGSWLLDLTAEALQESPDLADFAGRVSDSGEGRWTSIAAIEEGVPAPVFSMALYSRFASRGLDDFADKVLSAMRKQFGGHAEKAAPSSRHGPGDGHRHPAASHRPGGRAAGRGDRRRPGRGPRGAPVARGGHTPRATYERLATLVDDWEGVELWLGDERLVPARRPASRTTACWPRRCSSAPGRSPTRFRPQARRRRPRAPTRARSAGASRRDRTASRRSISRFWVSGEDGHTASLFPHAAALDVRGEVCVAVHDAPKPPPDRVSLTLDVLRAARRSLILAVGEAKAAPWPGFSPVPMRGCRPASLQTGRWS